MTQACHCCRKCTPAHVDANAINTRLLWYKCIKQRSSSREPVYQRARTALRAAINAASAAAALRASRSCIANAGGRRHTNTRTYDQTRPLFQAQTHLLGRINIAGYKGAGKVGLVLAWGRFCGHHPSDHQNNIQSRQDITHSGDMTL